MKTKTRMIGGLAALSMVFGLYSGAAYADRRDDLIQQQDQIESDIENLKSSLEGVDVELQEIYLNLQETKAQVTDAELALQTAQDALAESQREQEKVSARLEAAQGELQTIQSDIAAGQELIEQSKGNLGEIARAYYRGESLPTTLDLLFGSSSTDEFLNAYAANQAVERSEMGTLTQVEEISAQNLTREARQKDVEAEISELKDEADALVAQNQELTDAAQDRYDELTALQASYQDQSAQLETRKADFEQSMTEANAAADDTAAAIAQIDKENAEREAKAREEAAKQGGNVNSGSTTAGSGWLIPVVPAPFYVTSPYGMRNYPFGGYYMHLGVDIASACGAPQVAPASGTVARVVPAAVNGTHGNQIYINHGIVNGSSWVTVTNHLSAFNVSVGQQVTQGQVIGWTGQTGKVTGCHAHFEVWKDGASINPESLPGFTRSN